MPPRSGRGEPAGPRVRSTRREARSPGSPADRASNPRRGELRSCHPARIRQGGGASHSRTVTGEALLPRRALLAAAAGLRSLHGRRARPIPGVRTLRAGRRCQARSGTAGSPARAGSSWAEGNSVALGRSRATERNRTAGNSVRAGNSRTEGSSAARGRSRVTERTLARCTAPVLSSRVLSSSRSQTRA